LGTRSATATAAAPQPGRGRTQPVLRCSRSRPRERVRRTLRSQPCTGRQLSRSAKHLPFPIWGFTSGAAASTLPCRAAHQRAGDALLVALHHAQRAAALALRVAIVATGAGILTNRHFFCDFRSPQTSRVRANTQPQLCKGRDGSIVPLSSANRKPRNQGSAQATYVSIPSGVCRCRTSAWSSTDACPTDKR
jgi:hypothetical protein